MRLAVLALRSEPAAGHMGTLVHAISEDTVGRLGAGVQAEATPHFGSVVGTPEFPLI